MTIGTGIAIFGMWLFPSACVLSGNLSIESNIAAFCCTAILTAGLIVWRDLEHIKLILNDRQEGIK